MAKRDHYATLGVSRDSDDVVIRAAYKALMLKYHPDTNRDPAATARAAAINEAYAILGDRAKRAAYDAARRQQQSRGTDRAATPPSPPPRGSSAKPQPASSTEPEISWKPVLIAIVALIAFSVLASLNGRPSQATDGLLVTDMNSTDALGEMEDNMAAVDSTMGNDATIAATDTSPGSAIYNELSPDLNFPAVPMVQTATPLDFDTIEAAAHQFDRVLAADGMMGARTTSERCHKQAAATPSYPRLDRCAAFDYAAAALDRGYSNSAGVQRIPYFEFQEDNQADHYSAVGANRWQVQSRLQAIQKSAAEAMAAAVMARLAQDDRADSADNHAGAMNSSETPVVTASAPSATLPSAHNTDAKR